MLKKKDFRNTDALTAFVNANNVDVVNICYTPGAILLFYREQETQLTARRSTLTYVKGILKGGAK